MKTKNFYWSYQNTSLKNYCDLNVTVWLKLEYGMFKPHDSGYFSFFPDELVAFREEFDMDWVHDEKPNI